MPVNPSLRKLRYGKIARSSRPAWAVYFQASQGSRVRPCENRKKETNKNVQNNLHLLLKVHERNDLWMVKDTFWLYIMKVFPQSRLKSTGNQILREKQEIKRSQGRVSIPGRLGWHLSPYPLCFSLVLHLPPLSYFDDLRHRFTHWLKTEWGPGRPWL